MIDSIFLNTLLAFFFIKMFAHLKGHEPGIKNGKLILRIGAFLSLLFLLITAISHTLSPTYFSYIEVNLASIGEAWRQGHSIYTGLNDPSRYSILYGPWTSIANSLFLSHGDYFIPSSKLSGFLHLLLTFFCLWHAFSNQIKQRSITFLALGCCALLFLNFDNYAYTPRPDSYLIAYTAAGLWLVSSEAGWNKILKFILLGLLAGAATACKVHGLFYFLPLLALGVQKFSLSRQLFFFLIFTCTATAVALSPFLLPGVEFANYRLWLTAITRHGFSLELFSGNLTFILPFIFLLYLLGQFKPLTLVSSTLLISIGVACIFGSLIGAGTHHLLPLLPVIVFLIIPNLASFKPSGLNTRALAISLTLALFYGAVISQKTIWKFLADWPLQLEQQSDLLNLRSQLPDRPVELGYSSREQMELSYFKPRLYASGDSLLLDMNALMDMSASNIDIPNSTIEILRSCSIPYFILPKEGTPWAMQSGFGFAVFSKNWIEQFAYSYELVGSSKFYAAYKCNPRP